MKESELRLDPAFFFDREKPASHKLYVLDERRAERRIQRLEEDARLARANAEALERELAKLRVKLDAREAGCESSSPKTLSGNRG
jgi:hypothetical protein